MRRALPLLAAAVLGAALLALVGAMTNGEGGEGGERARAARPSATWTAPDRSFSIATPKGWKAVAAGPAATVLQRTDRRGLVVIRRRAAVRGSFAALTRTLTRRLDSKLPDFWPAGARVARLGTGRGLVYTFVRRDAGTVQSIVVAPAGERSYTLDLVAPGDARDVARELGGMVRSFTPRV